MNNKIILGIIVGMLVVGAVGFIIMSKNNKQENIMNTETKVPDLDSTPDPTNLVGAMELTEALRITKAWAEEVGGAYSLHNMNVESNGSFTVEVKGAFFRYKPEDKTLLVSGLVAYNIEDFFTLRPKKWEGLTKTAMREQSTLAEGRLELLNEPLLRWKPQVVLLTKPFLDNKISDGHFFTEVRWLLEWSTYWRTRRYTEVIENRDESALVNEAMEINDWVAKNRPRPW